MFQSLLAVGAKPDSWHLHPHLHYTTQVTQFNISRVARTEHDIWACRQERSTRTRIFSGQFPALFPSGNTSDKNQTCSLASWWTNPLSVRVICQQTQEDTCDALLLCPKMPQLPTFNHALKSSAGFSLDNSATFVCIHCKLYFNMDRLKAL